MEGFLAVLPDNTLRMMFAVVPKLVPVLLAVVGFNLLLWGLNYALNTFRGGVGGGGSEGTMSETYTHHEKISGGEFDGWTRNRTYRLRR